MGSLIRGVKNAFRNPVRTLSVVLILALSISLSLIMLLSYQTVQNKIASVKSSIGNTITINPAGAQGFEGGGEPLTDTQLDQVSTLSHVTSINKTLQDRLNAGTDTNLVAAIEAGTLGNRIGNIQRRQFEGSAPTPPANSSNSSNSSSGTTRVFTPPLMVSATSNLSSLITGETKLTSGSLFDVDSTENVAVIGTALATKNNLSIDSTFTAYSTAIKVVGIFDTGNTFSNSGIYLPIKTLQTLSDQASKYNAATVTVDSMENVDSVVSAIKAKLGSEVVDVTSNLEAANSAISPLENIRQISIYSLIGALVAGAVITLLIMMMIVRERRREIGVLKAIGASNIGVMFQFIYEALVLTLLGSVLGVIGGIAFSNPVLNVLVNNSTSNSSQTATTSGSFGGPGMGRVVQFSGQIGGGIRDAVSNLHATVGWDILGYGLLVAILIAVVGSAIPAFLIAKIRPAEVMRGE